MTWFRAHRDECLLLLAIFLLLAPLFAPGYILTLDMVFAPTMPVPQFAAGALRNALPLRWVVHLLSLVMPGWIVQKLMFLGLFGAMAWHAYRFLIPEADRATRTLMAVFFVFNPFVYTRFLAGQWTILLAYALLPLVWWASDLRSTRAWWKTALLIGGSLACVFTTSLHIGVMAVLLVAARVSITFSWRSWLTWKTLFAAVGIVVLATSYWTIPAFFGSKELILESFDARHLQAFATESDPRLGVVGNVLALHGFWGEREPWARQFVWMKDMAWVWGVVGLVLLAGIIRGGWRALRDAAGRREAVSLFVVGVLSVVFSLGIAWPPLAPHNQWLFEHVGFWRGFRDSQKWSALLVLVYAWYLGWGVVRGSRWSRTALLLAVLVFNAPMIGGFWGQLRPVWYPKDWQRANEILSADSSCKALFLPWHLYYSPAWNRGRLVANPAPAFFDCEVVVSRNVDLGAIRTQGPLDPSYDAIDGMVTGRDQLTPEGIEAVLRALKIGYVIVEESSTPIAPEFATWLRQQQKLFTGSGLTLYKRVE